MDVLRVLKRNALIFPMACAVVVAMILISEGWYWQLSGTQDRQDRLGAMAVVAAPGLGTLLVTRLTEHAPSMPVMVAGASRPGESGPGGPSHQAGV